MKKTFHSFILADISQKNRIVIFHQLMLVSIYSRHLESVLLDSASKPVLGLIGVGSILH